MNSRLFSLLAVLVLVIVCLIDMGDAQWGYGGGWRRRMWGGYPYGGYGGMGNYGMGGYGMGMGYPMMGMWGR